MTRARQIEPRGPRPQLLNLRTAPLLLGSDHGSLNERVWAHLRWLHPGGETQTEHVAARLVDRHGDLVLCRWHEARADTDHFWLHSLDVTPRGIWTS